MTKRRYLIIENQKQEQDQYFEIKGINIHKLDYLNLDILVITKESKVPDIQH